MTTFHELKALFLNTPPPAHLKLTPEQLQLEESFRETFWNKLIDHGILAVMGNKDVVIRKANGGRYVLKTTFPHSLLIMSLYHSLVGYFHGPYLPDRMLEEGLVKLRDSIDFLQIVSNEMKAGVVPRRDKRDGIVRQLSEWISNIENSKGMWDEGEAPNWFNKIRRRALVTLMMETFELYCPDLTQKDTFFNIALITSAFAIGEAEDMTDTNIKREAERLRQDYYRTSTQTS